MQADWQNTHVTIRGPYAVVAIPIAGSLPAGAAAYFAAALKHQWQAPPEQRTGVPHIDVSVDQGHLIVQLELREEHPLHGLTGGRPRAFKGTDQPVESEFKAVIETELRKLTDDHMTDEEYINTAALANGIPHPGF